MPCYSVQTTTVEFSERTSFDRMFEALQEMKLSPRRAGAFIYFNGGNYDGQGHAMTLEGQNVDARTKQIKASYAGAVAKFAFQKAGFQIKAATQQQVLIMGRR